VKEDYGVYVAAGNVPIILWFCCCNIVSVCMMLYVYPAILGSVPAGFHTIHWWCRKAVRL